MPTTTPRERLLVPLRHVERGDLLHIGRGISEALVIGDVLRLPVNGEWCYVVRYAEDEGVGPQRELIDADPLRACTVRREVAE